MPNDRNSKHELIEKHGYIDELRDHRLSKEINNYRFINTSTFHLIIEIDEWIIPKRCDVAFLLTYCNDYNFP
jgi:hypothetical protein